MAAAARNPFQLREGDDRPPFHSKDGSAVDLLSGASGVSAVPRFVFSPIIEPLPLAFTLGAAQRAIASNGGPSEEIEPESGTQHTPKFQALKGVLPVPSIRTQTVKFQKLQEYEGEVLSIRGSDFVARLVDLTDIGAQRLEATFSVDEVFSKRRTSLTRWGCVLLGHRF